MSKEDPKQADLRRRMERRRSRTLTEFQMGFVEGEQFRPLHHSKSEPATSDEDSGASPRVTELKEGYIIYRQKKKSSRSARTGYFKLAYPLLCVHDNHQDAGSPSFVMHLGSHTITREENSDTFRLQLVNQPGALKKVSYVLQCVSPADADEWVEAIYSAATASSRTFSDVTTAKRTSSDSKNIDYLISPRGDKAKSMNVPVPLAKSGSFLPVQSKTPFIISLDGPRDVTPEKRRHTAREKVKKRRSTVDFESLGEGAAQGIRGSLTLDISNVASGEFVVSPADRRSPSPRRDASERKSGRVATASHKDRMRTRMRFREDGKFTGSCLLDAVDYMFTTVHEEDFGYSIKRVIGVVMDVWTYYKPLEETRAVSFSPRQNLKALADHIFQVLNIPGFTNDTESSEEAQSSMLELCEKELGSDSCTSMRALRQKRTGFFPLKNLILAPGHSYFDYMFVKEAPQLLSPRGKREINRRSILSQADETIASAITIVEAQRFRNVKLTEFVGMRWQDCAESAPHLGTLIKAFNAYQVKSFKKLVNVAERLVELRNYNSAAAVIGGLSVSPVSRLERLRKSLPEKYSEKLEHLRDLFSPANSYAKYHALPTTSPYLPFLAAHQKILALIHLGNPSTLEEVKHTHAIHSSVCNSSESVVCRETCTLLNIEKMLMTADEVFKMRIQSPATTAFALLQVDAALVAALENIEPLDDEELFQCSVALQPFKGVLTEEEESDTEANGGAAGSSGELSRSTSPTESADSKWELGRPRKLPLARRQSTEEMLLGVFETRLGGTAAKRKLLGVRSMSQLDACGSSEVGQASEGVGVDEFEKSGGKGSETPQGEQEDGQKAEMGTCMITVTCAEGDSDGEDGEGDAKEGVPGE